MARFKRTIDQRDFSLGAVRPEAVDREDTEVIARSTKQCLNTISTSTGQMEGRPGTIFASTTTAKQGVEVDIGRGRVFDLQITPTGLTLYDKSETVVFSTSLDWSTIPDRYGTFAFDDISFWVLSDPETSSILIGAQQFPIQALVVDNAQVFDL